MNDHLTYFAKLSTAIVQKMGTGQKPEQVVKRAITHTPLQHSNLTFELMLISTSSFLKGTCSDLNKWYGMVELIHTETCTI